MDEKYFTLTSSKNHQVFIHAVPGHFIAGGNHLNYYIGTSDIKHHYRVSEEAAKMISEYYLMNGVDVDTILCLYDTETLGGYIAKELCSSNLMAPNPGDDIYVLAPEYDSMGNMFFRDNLKRMIEGRKVLIIISCITSGQTVKRAIECIDYYKGKTIGIAAAFSDVKDINGIFVNSIFGLDDVPNYVATSHANCEMCKRGQKIDAVTNGHGFSRL